VANFFRSRGLRWSRRQCARPLSLRQLRLQPFVHDEKRAHGLSRGAGLAIGTTMSWPFHRLERRLDEDRSTLSRITSRDSSSKMPLHRCGPRRPQSSAHAPSALPRCRRRKPCHRPATIGVGLDSRISAAWKAGAGIRTRPHRRAYGDRQRGQPRGWPRPLLRRQPVLRATIAAERLVDRMNGHDVV